MSKLGLACVFAVVTVASSGCGSGCSQLEPIPGGFPAAARNPNGGQVRVTQSGLATITADPAGVLGGLLDTGALPVVIDLVARPGDAPRLELRPVQNASRMDVTVRARMHTTMDIPVDIPLVGMCGVAIDTMPGPQQDVKIDAQINFTQDAMAGTTRIEVGTVSITQLTSDDVHLTGSLGCQLASLGLGAFIGTLTDTFADQIRSAIADQACKACPSGQVAECGQFASACTDNVCTRADGSCLQEVGLSGRARGAALFGGFSPGTLGAMDLYEVAGGYATSNNSGLALGLLSGFRPSGTPRDRCGPPATAPARVTIPQSTFFQGNTRPDTGAPFGLAIGLHQSQIDELAYSLYDGGMLCITVSTSTVDLLTTDTISLIAPSVANLVSKTGAVAVGLRPQSPPTMRLGRNTFMIVDGEPVVDEPLLDITFTGLELDFFASIEDQYVRLFTVTTDLHLPLGMQVGDTGELVPVFGSLTGAFTNLTVKNSDALTEDPAMLAQRFPSLLELALPGLAGGLGSFALPSLGGLEIHVTDVTAVDSNAFLAIFANLQPAMMKPRVETTAEIGDLSLPSLAAIGDPDRWSVDAPPRVELHLGGDATDLEWSWRTDGGLWSPWSPSPTQVVQPRTLWIPGIHRIEVRARQAGDAATTDETPVTIELPIGLDVLAKPAGFHGAAGAGGCNCATGGGGAGDALPGLLALGLLGLRGRARRARAVARRIAWRRLTTAALVLLLGAAMPACDCSSTPPCGDHDCMPGEVPVGVVGRYNSVAGDGTRTVVSTYDAFLGDLVLAEVAGDLSLTFTAVDGVPEETPTYHPSGYRGGIPTPGPDVGLYTSVQLRDGKVRVAYQDKDAGALKFAIEEKAGSYTRYVVEDDPSADLGAFASLALDGTGAPAIAYLATNVAVATGARTTELRLARANRVTPAAGDWTVSRLASAPASCAGLCGAGSACLAPAADGDPETCAVTTTDCTAACADDEACVAGTCRAAIPAPTAADLPGGTGLFANLVTLPDGRFAVVHYDRSRTALVLLVETGAGSSTFTETVLDDAGDRGMWASAVVGGDGTLHVAYQDALADTVYYLSWNGTATPPVLVDDGTRTGDRPHPVGAGITVYLDASNGPAIAYQDGATADLVVAHRSGTTWTAAPVASGRLLDGFHIAAAAGTMAWDQLDPQVIPPTKLSVQRAQ